MAMQWLRKLWQGSSLSRAEREQALRLGVYFIDAEGFDRDVRATFTRTVAVCLNADEAAERLRHPPRQPHWEDLTYKRWGPRPLSDLVERGDVDTAGARNLLARAARGEAHDLLPPPLTADEQREAERVEVWLIWYEDKFHYCSERDSYAVSVCLSRAEADAEYARHGRKPAESGGDGYEIVGPSSLKHQPAEVVRKVLRRRRDGEPGPVPIPSIYW